MKLPSTNTRLFPNISFIFLSVMFACNSLSDIIIISILSPAFSPKFNKFNVDWNAKGESAGYQSNDEVVACANELIVFNDSDDKLTQDIIQQAKSKNIPLTLIDLALLAHNRNICPKCGSKLVEKSGRYGHFLGCSNYPECKYKG